MISPRKGKKLSEDVVFRILAHTWINRGSPDREAAEIFGVHQTTIHRIRTGGLWFNQYQYFHKNLEECLRTYNANQNYA